MRKMFFICMMALCFMSSCAQTQPAASSMTQEEMQQVLAPIMEKLKAIPEDENEDKAVRELVEPFVREHDDAAGAFLVSRVLQYVMPKGELIALIDQMPNIKNDDAIKKSIEAWTVQEATSAGKPMRDFEAEYNGKVQHLSDYVGKGKYVVVDFWASWCGPCRREIPNLINVYNKYKGDKFDVIGVATWDKPADTERALEQMKIPYPQIINAQQAGSDAYGILGIPEIILFAPDGTIVARGLRGEMLEKAVQKALEIQN